MGQGKPKQTKFSQAGYHLCLTASHTQLKLNSTDGTEPHCHSSLSYLNPNRFRFIALSHPFHTDPDYDRNDCHQRDSY